MPVQIHNQAGEVISTSHNLRGIIANLAEPVKSVMIQQTNGSHSGQLFIEWKNGDYVHTDFASIGLMCGWILNRRNLRNVPLWINGIRSGEVLQSNAALTAYSR